MTLPMSSSDRITRLFRYWTELRVEGDLPGIASFDPLHLPDLLPSLWLVAWDEKIGDFVYRIAGDYILRTHDQPMHRRSLREIYPPQLADHLRERFTLLCSDRCLYHSRGTIYIRINRYGLGERLILPFRDRDGVTPVVLGCTDYNVAARTSSGEEDLPHRDVEIRTFLSLDGEVLSSERKQIASELG